MGSAEHEVGDAALARLESSLDAAVAGCRVACIPAEERESIPTRGHGGHAAAPDDRRRHAATAKAWVQLPAEVDVSGQPVDPADELAVGRETRPRQRHRVGHADGTGCRRERRFEHVRAGTCGGSRCIRRRARGRTGRRDRHPGARRTRLASRDRACRASRSIRRERPARRCDRRRLRRSRGSGRTHRGGRRGLDALAPSVIVPPTL